MGRIGTVVAVGLLMTAASGTAQMPELGGTVVVANKQAASASFIDVASGEVVATVPTGEGPHELVVSADGATAVVTDYGAPEPTLTVLDVATASVARTIDLGEWTRPHGIVWLPGDTLVAVTSETKEAVVVVDVPDGRIAYAIPTAAQGSHMVAATADGRFLYTGDMGSHTVSELDGLRRSRTRGFVAGPRPEAITVTPSGDRVFVGSNDEGTVSEIRPESGRRREIAAGFGWPYRIFLTPGVEQILVPDLEREVLRFFDGESYDELGSIAFPGEGPQGLTLHPDGRHLFLSLSRAGRIAVVDIEAREVVGYLPAGAGPDGIGYSPLTLGG